MRDNKKEDKKFPYRTMKYWILILKVNEHMVFDVGLLGIPIKKAQSYIHNFTYLGDRRYRSRIIDGNKLLVKRISDAQIDIKSNEMI